MIMRVLRTAATTGTRSFSSRLSHARELEPALKEGFELLEAKGYHMNSVWEQAVAWGENDSFRHLNNVHYARYAESGRIRFMEQMALEAAGPHAVKDMISGKGVGLILKSLSISYRRPVTYPDTLLIAQRPYDIHPTAFSTNTMFYSLAQGKPVASAESVCVWYDYEKLGKTEGPANMMAWLKEREHHKHPHS